VKIASKVGNISVVQSIYWIYLCIATLKKGCIILETFQIPI